MLFILLDLEQARLEHLHRLILVLVLRALVLTLHDHACGLMGDADSGRGLIDMLTARARGTEGVDLQIIRVDVHLYVIRFRKDGDRRRRGVDAPRALGLGHTLDAVGARLELEAAVGARSADDEGHFLIAAEPRFIEVDDLYLVAPALGIHAVHTVQVIGEQ